MSAVFEILEHVQACTGRREQYRIAGLGQFGCQLNSVLKRLNAVDRRSAIKRRRQLFGIAAKQDDRAALMRDRTVQG